MNYFTPLSSSYTQSGTSDNKGGGQTKKDDQIADSTEETRDAEKNETTKAEK